MNPPYCPLFIYRAYFRDFPNLLSACLMQEIQHIELMHSSGIQLKDAIHHVHSHLLPLLFPFFFSSRLPIVCLQRAHDPGWPRKPHSYRSPNRHLGVCCDRIPSAHCVLEQARWEKFKLKEKVHIYIVIPVWRQCICLVVCKRIVRFLSKTSMYHSSRTLTNCGLPSFVFSFSPVLDLISFGIKKKTSREREKQIFKHEQICHFLPIVQSHKYASF